MALAGRQGGGAQCWQEHQGMRKDLRSAVQADQPDCSNEAREVARMQQDWLGYSGYRILPPDRYADGARAGRNLYLHTRMAQEQRIQEVSTATATAAAAQVAAAPKGGGQRDATGQGDAATSKVEETQTLRN